MACSIKTIAKGTVAAAAESKLLCDVTGRNYARARSGN
jgi:hypothetical protein